MKGPFLCFFIIVVWGFISYAQVIHIPEDQPTIQAGIDAEGTGDTALVGEGTYYAYINFQGKAITVASH